MPVRTDRNVRRYDAVIFDLGGVLISSPFDLVAQLARDNDIEPEQLVNLIYGYGYDSHPWHACERGELTYEAWAEQARTLISDVGHHFDPARILKEMETLIVHSAMLDCVRRLRADGYKTAILTNNIAEYRAWWHNQIPVDELFDTVVDSHEEGLRKPDPAIYTLTLERLGAIAPERAVFLDDAVVNLQGAERAGLTAVLVTDEKQGVKQLEAVLVR